jgi:hypothetical protein
MWLFYLTKACFFMFSYIRPVNGAAMKQHSLPLASANGLKITIKYSGFSQKFIKQIKLFIQHKTPFAPNNSGSFSYRNSSDDSFFAFQIVIG